MLWNQSGRRSVTWLISGLVLAGCGLGGPAHNAPLPGTAAAVDMGFQSFQPTTVNIRVGQTVEWRNSSIITHSVVDDPKLATKPEDAALPAGATAINSGDIPAGKIFTYTFERPGTYRYFCSHHEGDGMIGTVIVAPAS